MKKDKHRVWRPLNTWGLLIITGWVALVIYVSVKALA